MVRVIAVPSWSLESNFGALKGYLELPWESSNNGLTEHTILGCVKEPIPQIIFGRV